MSTNQVYLQYKPLPWQERFHSCSARFRVVCNGRQTGKTVAALHELVSSPRYGAAIKKNKVYYWVDPTYKFSTKCMDIFAREYSPAVRKQLGIRIRKSAEARELVFENTGSKISFFTAQSPDTLVGDAIDGVVINEAGLIENPDIWNQMIRPALGVKKGFAIFVSTPRTKNWYYDLFKQGQGGCKHWESDYELRDSSCNIVVGQKHLWHTFQTPTTASSSLMSAEEIEMARTSPGMTNNKFNMEYLAQFIAESSSVFRNYHSCVRGSLEPPHPNGSYYIGVDIAKNLDWTVITVLDRNSQHVVHFDRFQGLPWPLIEKRIESVYHRYPGRVIADGTGVGDAICSNLRAKIPNLQVVVFNNQRKSDVIENLVSAIEHESISFPAIPELLQELSDFEYKVSGWGNIKYQGRQFAHDDCVISLALACWPLRVKPVTQLTHNQIKMVKRGMRL